VSTRNQLATQVQHAALYSSDFWVELSRDLQYAHHPVDAGPAREKLSADVLPQDRMLPRNVALSMA
jgi:hypothetical protein